MYKLLLNLLSSWFAWVGRLDSLSFLACWCLIAALGWSVCAYVGFDF